MVASRVWGAACSRPRSVPAREIPGAMKPNKRIESTRCARLAKAKCARSRLKRALATPMSAVLSTIALIAITVNSPVSAQTWATATSTHATNGRVIVFRYIDTFAPGFDQKSQPHRAIIQWKYPVEANKGMPTVEERQRMDALENLLEPVMDKDDFATLALVSTGEHLREWIYYCRNDDEFMTRLNKALAGNPPFPIEIQLAEDAQWQSYDDFKRGLAQ
jgi:hypothetical protein